MSEFKVLLVDDHPSHMNVIMQCFEEFHKNFDVFIATNGVSAYEICCEEKPDLIITDWEMPEMSGIDLIRKIKRNPLLEEAPIIMCTGAMTSSEHLNIALSAGAFDFVRKPIDKIELIARVNSALKLYESFHTIKAQKEKIEINQQKLTDSISYAKNLQIALLPNEAYFSSFVSEHFIMYKPRDIVSGDFYWLKQINGKKAFALADCTGHGVPGAFISSIGISLLNEVVSVNNIEYPNNILNELRTKLKILLKQTNVDATKFGDGMDMALCCYEQNSRMLQYSGANIPLYILRKNNGENIHPNGGNTLVKQTDKTLLFKYEPDKMPVSVYLKEDKFTLAEIQLEKDDEIILFSDGYTDQFGGKSNRKYMVKNFEELLLEIAVLPLSTQKKLLDIKLREWMGGQNAQVDDITVLGLKIK